MNESGSIMTNYKYEHDDALSSMCFDNPSGTMFSSDGQFGFARWTVY